MAAILHAKRGGSEQHGDLLLAALALRVVQAVLLNLWSRCCSTSCYFTNCFTFGAILAYWQRLVEHRLCTIREELLPVCPARAAVCLHDAPVSGQRRVG